MRSSRRASGLVASLALVLLAVSVPPAHAYAAPGATTRISPLEDANGEPVPGTGTELSGDGSVAALLTIAPLLAEDTNGVLDVYLRDLDSPQLELATLTDGEGLANGHTDWVRLSDDGRFLAFRSAATNLVGSDANGPTADVYVRDRLLGTTTRASVSTSGAQNISVAWYPDISDDGRYVTFTSSSANLVAGDANGQGDVFVRDMVAGTTEIATRRADGSQTVVGTDLDPAISGDGRYVVFATADPMVAEDINAPARDIYVHDRVTGVNELVSVASDGSQGPTAAFYPEINRDGRFVTFSSFNANYVPNDNNGFSESFVHDRQTGITERISVTRSGGQANHVAGVPRISDDGRYVLYGTLATNMGWADANEDSDVYRYDRLTRTTEAVSVTPEGNSVGDFWSYQAAISGDGRLVAFYSEATNLTPPAPGGPGSYIRDFGPSVGVGEAVGEEAGPDLEVEGWARFAGGPMLAVADPAGDGRATAGADLTGAQVFYRPEGEDLRVQLDLAPYVHPYPPLVGTDAPKPGTGLTYILELLVEGARLEVRAVDGPGDDSFTIRRCAPICVQSPGATGGIGTESDRVLISAPLSALGIEEGDTISGGKAAVTMKIDAVTATLDQAVLPAAEIPRATVSLGFADEDTPPGEVVFGQAASLIAGRFFATLPAGAGNVWARACLGAECGVRSVRVG